MLKIQSELKAPKGQFNAFGKYNYRSCEDILEGVKPLLKELNCVILVSDSIEMIGDRIYVKATAKFVECETGDTIENTAYARESLTKKGMDDSQVTGATSSYARKYALNGLFLIDDTKDADATNDHKPKEDAKPFMTDEKMIGLIARYNDGERDIFEKAKAHMILRDKDLLTIKAMK